MQPRFHAFISLTSLLTIFGIYVWGCTTHETRLAPQYSEAELPAIDSTIFEKGVVWSTLQGSELTEVSGLVPSVHMPGSWWMINDSGNGSRLYRVDSTGHTEATFVLDGIPNRDWEDMAMRVNPLNKQSEMLIADIGDNRAVFDFCYVYRLAEPITPSTTTPVTLPRTAITRYTFQYPDGARDAEAFMVDPMDQQWYIVSKREDSVRVYRYPCRIDSEACEKRIVQLERVTELPMTLITAGDISSDGQEILIRTYVQLYYWKRQTPTEPLVEVLKRAPVRIPRRRDAQGESIAFFWDPSRGFITASELADADDQPLYWYRRR